MEAKGMGVFDFLKGGAKKTETAAQSTAAASTAADAAAAGAAEEESVISGLFGEGGAKVSGVLDKLKLGGLEDAVTSWIGKGENKAISADQIKAALGSEQIAGVAAKLGISAEEAAGKIAKVLPGIIDKLTPDGIVPDPDAIAGKLTGLFKK
jgi:uncharacterized protein YidB (DUF937 family)